MEAIKHILPLRDSTALSHLQEGNAASTGKCQEAEESFKASLKQVTQKWEELLFQQPQLFRALDQLWKE